MKKVVLSAIFIWVGVFCMNAQDIDFGVKAGANLASFSGSDVPGNFKTKIGFHVGILAEFKFNGRFSIQPELLYSLQGAKQSRSTPLQTIDTKLNLSYITLPILAKYYFTQNFSVHFGPQISALLSAKLKRDDFEKDATDQYSSFDTGLAFGAGYKLKNGIFFNARYYIGLAELPDLGRDLSVHNSVIQVSVGYVF